MLDSNFNFNDHVISLMPSFLSTPCQVSRVILNSLVISKLFFIVQGLVLSRKTIIICSYSLCKTFLPMY